MNSKTNQLFLRTARQTAFHKLPQAIVPFGNSPILIGLGTQELNYLTLKTISNENKGR